MGNPSSIPRRKSPAARALQQARRWQLQDAKARFSEVFNRAQEEGPQVVTRHNRQTVVIVSEDDYKKFTQAQTPSLIEALLAMPKVAGFKIPPRDKNDTVPSDRNPFS